LRRDDAGDNNTGHDGGAGAGAGDYSLARALRSRASDRGLRPFAFLWQPYEPAYFWLELLECARSVVLMGGLMFIGGTLSDKGIGALRAACGFCVAVIALVGYREVWLRVLA
jgi:hypothetical protein